MLLKQEEIEDLLGTMFSGELIPTLWSSQYLLQQDSMWRQNLYDKKKSSFVFVLELCSVSTEDMESVMSTQKSPEKTPLHLITVL